MANARITYRESTECASVDRIGSPAERHSLAPLNARRECASSPSPAPRSPATDDTNSTARSGNNRPPTTAGSSAAEQRLDAAVGAWDYFRKSSRGSAVVAQALAVPTPGCGAAAEAMASSFDERGCCALCTTARCGTVFGLSSTFCCSCLNRGMALERGLRRGKQAGARDGGDRGWCI